MEAGVMAERHDTHGGAQAMADDYVYDERSRATIPTSSNVRTEPYTSFFKHVELPLW